MTQKSIISYPASELDFDRLLHKLGFVSGIKQTIDLIGSNFERVYEVSEFLWTDIRFFSICQKLNSGKGYQWLVEIKDPEYNYYLNLYRSIPAIFSTDINSPDEYYNIISKPIGKSNADAVIYVWNICIVRPNSDHWAFWFDRENEQGKFYCHDSTHIPEELMPFIE